MTKKVYVPAKPNVRKKMKSKYRNVKVEFQGKKFDSIGERDRYIFLKDCEKRGEIQNLQCQVKYTIKAITPAGNYEILCDYYADFVYEKKLKTGLKNPVFVDLTQIATITADDESGQVWQKVVEDFKGVRTPVFNLKMKLMKILKGIEIRIVKSPTLPI